MSKSVAVVTVVLVPVVTVFVVTVSVSVVVDVRVTDVCVSVVAVTVVVDAAVYQRKKNPRSVPDEEDPDSNFTTISLTSRGIVEGVDFEVSHTRYLTTPSVILAPAYTVKHELESPKNR